MALTEGSIYERLRRVPHLPFDAHLAHAALIYNETGRRLLEATHREYWEIGCRYGLPMVALTDTWRASRARIARSRFRDHPVNEDHVRFLRDLRATMGDFAGSILVGGTLGPAGDAYRPGEALAPADAESFHAPQVDALAGSGVDFLLASTLPAVSEARGLSRAMARTAVPYVLSFVIRADGTVLDGTPLQEAIESIDGDNARPPAGYAVNCVHPAVLDEGLRWLPPTALARLVMFQANASSRPPEELDGRPQLESDDPALLSAAMVRVWRSYNISVLGGCCGTDARHIERLAVRMTEGAGA